MLQKQLQKLLQSRQFPQKQILEGIFSLSFFQLLLHSLSSFLYWGKELFKGYWNLAQINPEEWFPTNDLGEIHQGDIRIIGRKDNQFISGGENIQPEEIEKELLQHPDILAAVVVPKNDPEFGQIPLAFIQTFNKKFDPLSLKNFLSDRLAKFKIPKTFYPLDFIEENSMKISRKKIIDQLQNKSIF